MNNNLACRLLFWSTVFTSLCPSLSASDHELAELVQLAFDNNPAIQAARFEAQRARAEREALGGFFDPTVNVETSRDRKQAGYDQTRIRAGVDAALPPGLYLGTRVEESYYNQLPGDANPGESDNLWQSMLGLRLSMPLLRDRGFRQWQLSDERAEKLWRMAEYHWQTVAQECRHNVEQQYISVLETDALLAVSQAALQRVEKLLHEAEQLVQLKIVPEYQLFTARAEVALWREAETSARQNCTTMRDRLAQLIGVPQQLTTRHITGAEIVNWSQAASLPNTYDQTAALLCRGDYQELIYFIEAAEKEKAIQRDKLKSDLSMAVDASLQGEDKNRVIATEREISERNLGATITLSWKRPWGYRAEKARVRVLEATIAERREMQRQAALRITTELKVYHAQFLANQARLSLVTEAIGSARQALEAENERFCLGEGRSRNVLDAQKDLTDAQKRQIVIAVELLRAYSNFRYAAGYNGELAE